MITLKPFFVLLTKQRRRIKVKRQRGQHVGIEQTPKFLFSRHLQRIGHVRLAFAVSRVLALVLCVTAGGHHDDNVVENEFLSKLFCQEKANSDTDTF
jgi:hypothetical protein